MRAVVHGLAVLGALAAACNAAAHEFWAEPTSFALDPGGRIGVRLCVGDGFEGWSQARNPARIVKFLAVGPGGPQAVVGLDGAEPAGAIRLSEPGDYVIVYRSNRAFTEMPAAEFDEYLRDKGLDRVIVERESFAADGRPVREAYSRHAKALIRVGEGAGMPTDRVMNLPLELVVDIDRADQSRDERRRFRLLHQGRPLAGALVAAFRPGTSDEPLTSRTDADGRVTFRLQSIGRWRISAVHMARALRGIDAEYESLWASLTFELAAPESARAPATACRNRVAA